MEESSQLSFLKPLNNQNYTYKSSELIENSYELTLNEQRIISIGCKKLQPIYIENKLKPSNMDSVLAAMKFTNLNVTVDEFKREYGLKTNRVYEYMRDAAKTLFERKIWFYKKEGVLTDRRWVSEIEYNSIDKCINLTFNQNMISDLLVFKGKYVALFFDMTQNIRSKYAFRLYEILKNNAYLGSYQVSIEKLKFMLAIEGYEKFQSFNSKVIKPNIEAINKYSDILVYEIQPMKKGRFVDGLVFNMKLKEKVVFLPDTNFKKNIPKAFAELSEALKPLNVTLSSEDAEKIYNAAIDYTIANVKGKEKDLDATSYILSKIEIMKSYTEISTVKSKIGFLRWAVQTDFELETNGSLKFNKKLKFDNFEGRNQGEDYYNNLDMQFQNGYDNFDEAAMGDDE